MNVEELRTQLRASRDALREAIEAVAERWDEECLPAEAPQVDPGAEDATWSPREAAQHAVLAQAFHAMILARALYRFETPAEAVHALDAVGAIINAVAAEVTDDDLDRFASGIGEGQQAYLRQLGFEPERDVRAVLQIGAGHLRDHAQHLRKAAGAG